MGSTNGVIQSASVVCCNGAGDREAFSKDSSPAIYYAARETGECR